MQKGFALTIILAFLAAISLGVLGYYLNNQQQIKKINSFEECSKLFPVMESYPAQCNTPDGKHFVQELSEEEKEKLVPPTEFSKSALSDVTGDWEIYANSDLGFEVKYPPSHVLVLNDSKKKNPTFLEKSYQGFASPGLYLDWEPFYNNKDSYLLADKFDSKQQEVGGSLNIVFEVNGKKIYAGCQLNPGFNEVEACNKILLTLKPYNK